MGGINFGLVKKREIESYRPIITNMSQLYRPIWENEPHDIHIIKMKTTAHNEMDETSQTECQSFKVKGQTIGDQADNRRIVSKSRSSKKFKFKVTDNLIFREESQQLSTCTDDVTSAGDETFAS